MFCNHLGYPALEGHSRISLDKCGDSIPWNTHGKYNIWQIQKDGGFKVNYEKLC